MCVYPGADVPVLMLLKIPVSTARGAAVPLHTSPNVCPVVALAWNLMLLSKSCSPPVIAIPVASVVAKLSFDHSKVSVAPVPSILT